MTDLLRLCRRRAGLAPSCGLLVRFGDDRVDAHGLPPSFVEVHLELIDVTVGLDIDLDLKDQPATQPNGSVYADGRSWALGKTRRWALPEDIQQSENRNVAIAHSNSRRTQTWRCRPCRSR